MTNILNNCCSIYWYLDLITKNWMSIGSNFSSSPGSLTSSTMCRGARFNAEANCLSNSTAPVFQRF